MIEHDPLCPTVYLPGEGGCRCALIARVRADEDAKNTAARAELYVELNRVRRKRDAARAEVERLRSPEWEAEVRADERERIVAKLEGPAQESEAMYAHAEAVAARLVEVICDDEHWRSEARLEAVKRAYAERDAARAELDALRKEVKNDSSN